MLLNRRTLSVGTVSILFLILSGQSAFAFSMPEVNIPTISVPTPAVPNTTSIQTHIQITNTTSSNTISSSSPTPTPTKTPSPIPTPTPTNSSVKTPTTPQMPSWFQSFSSLFNWATPTPTQSEQSTPTPTPTKNPTPTPTYMPTPTPTTATSSSSLLDDKQQYMMDAINAYRAQNGLYAVKPSKETCDFAKVRAQEITTDFSHNGWETRVNNGTIPFSYSMITENIAMTSDYKNVVNLWINSPGHAANMRADTPYVCVGYSGNYYAYEGMRP